MENASRALIMAGAILLGILLISIMVYLFNQGSSLRGAYSENINATRINEFNSKFEKYNITKTDYNTSKYKEYVTIRDIVTLANYAKEFNKGLADTDSNYIHVYADIILITKAQYNSYESTMKGRDITKDSDDTLKKRLSDNINVKFYCNGIEYSPTTGRIISITFGMID